MPKPRCSGLSRSMRVESSQMLPFDSVSSPARQLSAVDLPQPDGPSNAMNSPRRTFSVTPLSASRLPKRRLIPSSLSSRKSRAAMAMIKCLPGAKPARIRASLLACHPSLLFLLCADLFVPTGEGIDELVRQEWQFLLVVRDRRGILVATKLLDDLLAFLRCHRKRHVLHRWSWIEIARVIGCRLRFLREQVVEQIDQHRELLVRHSLRDAEIMGIEDPVEVLEEKHLCFFGHHAERTRIDVPSHLRRDHVARTLAELLHHRACAGRIIFDVLTKLLEIRPRLVPAIPRVARIFVAENIRQSHHEHAARA